MKLKCTNLVSRIANSLSFVVLLLLLVFSIWAAMLIQQAASAAELSTSVSNTYEQILNALSDEEAFEYEYVLNPSTGVRNEHLAAATRVSDLVQVLLHDSTTDDNAVGQHVLTEQASYLFYGGQFFSAIDAKDFIGARTIHSEEIDPLFTQIENELSQQAKVEQAEATHDLAQLIQLQQTIFITAPIVFAIDLLLFGITMYVMRSYRRKLDETTQAEIARPERMALTDPLTGLGNHYAYQEHLARALEEAHRGGEPLVLALLDIDEFKAFND